MIHASEIWKIIEDKMPRGRWIALQEIYSLVKNYSNLDTDDFEPEVDESSVPKWKRNVRNVLQRKKSNRICWDEKNKGFYLLTEK
jgi:hypothetical protein